MRSPRGRRLGRLTLLRALRLVRHHHLSLLTAAILTVVLTVALSDGGFTESRPNAPGQAPPAAPTPSERLLNSTEAAAAGSMSVIYYLVDSVEQIELLSTTVRNDTQYLLEQVLPPLPPVWSYFLVFDTPQKEAEGARFLTQLAESAPRDGFNLRVVDLTR